MNRQQHYHLIIITLLLLIASQTYSFSSIFQQRRIIIDHYNNNINKNNNHDYNTLRRTSFSISSSYSSSFFQLSAYPPRKNNKNKKYESSKEGENNNNDEYDKYDEYDPIFDEATGRQGDGRNWIEKSSPIGIGKLKDEMGSSSSSSSSSGKKSTDTDGNYDLGIDGISFQTGPLSNRMYDALSSVAMKRFPAGTTTLPPELDDVYKLYAMDITAKEAVKAALEQNGMQLALINEDDPQSQDEGMWGVVDSIRLYDSKTDKFIEETYECLDDAIEIGNWFPGQSFSFVVRNVPAKLKEMDVSDLLKALDPDGKYREEANEKGITMPDEDIISLKNLGKDCDRRTNTAPEEASAKEQVFKGNDSKGYNIMKRSDLLADSRNSDGTENNDVLMHVMNALVSHSCLIVDLSDGGMSSLHSQKLAKMWEVVDKFFQTIETDSELEKTLPELKQSKETGSPNAVCGYKSYNEGAMKFLETRILRHYKGEEVSILPTEVATLVGKEGIEALFDSFNSMCSIGKDVVRVSVAASNMEYDGFLGERFDGNTVEEESSDLPFISGLTFEDAEFSGIGMDEYSDEQMFVDAEKLSSEAALKLTEDLIDDGIYQDTNPSEQRVNMSPHRICRYVNNSETQGKKEKETFGAHTDTSFVTIVPVAAVSGLEIFDEEAIG